MLKVSFGPLAVFLMSALALAQETRTITISEPGTVALRDLFHQADVVALVQIISGDSENYETAVYKSKVLTGFKGSSAGQLLFFGPFIGYEVGSEYIAFLRRAKVGPKVQATDVPTLNYGELGTFHLIMYEGYSILPIRYACIFGGKEIKDQCGYGVRVNTYQVVLPSSIKTFPRKPNDADDRKWVRRDEFLRLVDSLRRTLKDQ
jgi:hypothetical protein